MPDTERGTYPIHLPQELCDRLAARSDTLPRHMWIRLRVFVNFCEGRIAEITEKFLNWREHPTLSEEKLDGWLAKQNLTREEFREQFAPELAFLRAGSELLLARTPREELDAGLCRAAEEYLAAPSPRSEQERLDCVVKNRGGIVPPVAGELPVDPAAGRPPGRDRRGSGYPAGRDLRAGGIGAEDHVALCPGSKGNSGGELRP